MDDDKLFFTKWVIAIVFSLIFIGVGYVIAPENFTVVLGIILMTGCIMIYMGQRGQSDAY